MPKRRTRRRRKRGGNTDAAKKIQKLVRGRQSRKKTIERLSQNPFSSGATSKDGTPMRERRGSHIEREFNISPTSETPLARDVKESSEKRVRDTDEISRQKMIHRLTDLGFQREYLEQMTSPARLLRMNSGEDYLPEEELNRRRLARGEHGGRRRKSRRRKSRRRKSRRRKSRRRKSRRKRR